MAALTSDLTHFWGNRIPHGHVIPWPVQAPSSGYPFHHPTELCLATSSRDRDMRLLGIHSEEPLPLCTPAWGSRGARDW